MLDIGSGTGKVYRKLREHGDASTWVTLLEPSLAMCINASTYFGDDNRVEVINGTILGKDLTKCEKYHVVTLLQVLHHMTDPVEELHALKSYVMKDAVLIALCIGERYHENLFQFNSEGNDPVGRKTLTAWKQLFEISGWSTETVFDDRFHTTFESVENYNKFARSIGLTFKLNNYETTQGMEASEFFDTNPNETSPLDVYGQHYTFVCQNK